MGRPSGRRTGPGTGEVLPDPRKVRTKLAGKLGWEAGTSGAEDAQGDLGLWARLQGEREGTEDPWRNPREAPRRRNVQPDQREDWRRDGKRRDREEVGFQLGLADTYCVFTGPGPERSPGKQTGRPRGCSPAARSLAQKAGQQPI